MEDIGPDGIKRQRLDSAGNSSVQRMQQQQQQQQQFHPHTGPPSQQNIPLHSSGYGGPSLGPPPSYSSVPPSPYGSHHQPDPRHVAGDPQQYGHPASGYSTPNRDVRPPFAEPGAPGGLARREGSNMAGQVRSPDDVQPHPHHPQVPQHAGPPQQAIRPINTEFGGQEYAQSYAPTPTGHPGEMGSVDASAGAAYMNHDPQQPNGTYHGLPMNQAPQSASSHPHGMATVPPPHHGPPAGGPPGPGQPPPHSAYSAPGAMPSMDYTPTTPVYGSAYNAQLAAAQQSQGQQPKRNARATQACENCRQRKAKCDEGKPQCGHCRENNLECRYKEIPPAKAERAQREMIDKFDSIKHDSEDLMKKVAMLEDQNGKILEMLDILQRSVGQGSPSGRSLRPPSHGTLGPSPIHEISSSSTKYNRRHQGFQVSGVQQAGVDGAQAGGPIIVAHKTGAHRLLNWDKIKQLLAGFPIDENYVMKLEEQKGVLHYYGKGQSQDKYEGSVSNTPGSPASPASDDIAASQESWGIDLGRPYLSEGHFYSGKEEHLGGLTLDGTLNLDWPVMQRLMNKYIESIHILHPFLDTGNLLRMFERVHRQANPGAPASHTSSPFLKNVMQQPARPPKRKYSTDLGGEPGTPGGHGNRGGAKSQEQPVERRISTAIVLLVMALGKICEHSDPLPGPVPDASTPTPITAKVMPAPNSILPIKAESPVSSGSPHRDPGSSIPSPMSINERMPSSSSTSVTAHSGATPQDASRPMRSGDKNVDVIPGLAYYVRAVEILGLLHGGNELSHAQAFILAGLYASQNGCVFESWAWLQDACRVARFLVRDDYLREEDHRSPSRAQIMRFVFYTALQLESDITAEVDVQSSGIAQLHKDRVWAENEIGYPANIADDNSEIASKSHSMSKINMFYSYQLSMRTLLNDIQEHLYPTTPPAPFISMAHQDHFDDRLKQWRSFLVGDLSWNDDEEPAKSMNEARLRAKYYGARYIVHRPSLYHALHEMTKEDWPDGMWNTQDGKADASANDMTDEGDPIEASHDLTEKQERILKSCNMCIKSAMHSTIAFDGVMFDRSGKNIRHRMMVTNPMGTAHAQFGNMLVLAATYKSYLSSLVERNKLIRLLKRTIKLLQSLAPISTTLSMDARILSHVLRTVVEGNGRSKSNDAEQAAAGDVSSILGGSVQYPGSQVSTPTQRAQRTPVALTSSFSSIS